MLHGVLMQGTQAEGPGRRGRQFLTRAFRGVISGTSSSFDSVGCCSVLPGGASVSSRLTVGWGSNITECANSQHVLKRINLTPPYVLWKIIQISAQPKCIEVNIFLLYSSTFLTYILHNYNSSTLCI